MFELSSLLVFMTAALILLVTPGPAVLFIVARSLEQGRWAGIISVLGIGLAALVHVAVAAMGLSAILVQSALAFSAVKYLGAAYLIYLGVRTLLEPAKAQTIGHLSQKPLWLIFRQGFVVNLLNPKTALFFFAFLPQFIDPARGSVTLQIMALGMIFVIMAILSDSVYALAAGTARSFLAGNRRMAQIQKWFAGTVYIGLGITTAISGGDARQ